MSEFIRNLCGLLFTTEDEPRVLLACRNIDGQPMYDGLGCRMEPDARLTGPQIQLSEQVYAETGILTRPEDWTEILTLRGDDWEVIFMFVFADNAELARSQGSDHQDDISFENPDVLPINIVQTMKWLIPLVLDDSIHKPLGISGVPLL